MLDKRNRFALILGSGSVARTLIDKFRLNKDYFIIVGIKDSYDNHIKYEADYLLEYNKLGNIFKILEDHEIKNIIFLGKIKKINFTKLKPDFITLYYILRISFRYFKGDGELLNKILNIFISKGYKIIDSRIYLSDLLATKKYNNINKHKHKINLLKIKKYFELAKNEGLKDKGQAIIISDDKIILAEDNLGTDSLIKRFQKISNYKNAFLVKVSKPNQSLYVDLPTIGPNTIINILNAGIKGIILENQKVYISDLKTTLDLINKNNLMYYAV